MLSSSYSSPAKWGVNFGNSLLYQGYEQDVIPEKPGMEIVGEMRVYGDGNYKVGD